MTDAVPRPPGAVRRRRLHQRCRPRLARRGHAGGLPRRRRRADGRPRPRGPPLDGAAGAALLLSLGFRPTWISPERVWRLPAVRRLAMADAAEEVAGLAPGTIRLKWPNDLVSSTTRRRARPQARRRARRDRRPRDATIRGSSSGSGSTPTGAATTSRPSWPATMTASARPRTAGRSTAASCSTASSSASRPGRGAPERRVRRGDWAERQVTTGRARADRRTRRARPRSSAPLGVDADDRRARRRATRPAAAERPVVSGRDPPRPRSSRRRV